MSIKDYRYERKFLVTHLTENEIESIIKGHIALFSEIYSSRYINNIYFDSINLQNYFDSVDGISDRTKIRIRWYGKLFGVISNPILEFKVKAGQLNKKSSFILKSFRLDCDFKISSIFETIDSSDMPKNIKQKIKLYQPVLLNRYRRKYFQSFDKNYRITIDKNLSYYKINKHTNNFLNKSVDHLSKIVELKYHSSKDSYAEAIVSSLPFRLNKNSKYVNGLESKTFF